MKLRRLKKEDAELMLEWMHDDFVVQDLSTDFKTKALDDCNSFIIFANAAYEDMNNCENLHVAIADDEGEYMGTVSLKNIDRVNKMAEFAIVVRSSGMGKGYGVYAMNQMLKFGFEDPRLLLEDIYWCVNKRNIRARRFYDKQKYKIVEANKNMMINYKNGGVLN